MLQNGVAPLPPACEGAPDAMKRAGLAGDYMHEYSVRSRGCGVHAIVAQTLTCTHVHRLGAPVYRTLIRGLTQKQGRCSLLRGRCVVHIRHRHRPHFHRQLQSKGL